MWTEKELKNIDKRNVREFSGIYIGGGNTPYLLKTLKEMKFLDFLEKAMLQSIPIYGGSAGAIILGKTIIPSLQSDENFVMLKNFSEMNKIKGYDIWCHYKKNEDQKIKESMKRYKLKKIMALPEGSGIYLHNKKMKIIGEKSAFVFCSTKKEEFKVNSFLD